MNSRRGSALLIVLGMLAFMVVSGVAFAVFMRSSRLPASFTRRTTSTRQLAKAALAEAIDQIDRSIGNDPHPDISKNSSESYNCWLRRVLVTPYLYVDDSGDEDSLWAHDVRSRILSKMVGSGSQNASDYDPATIPVLSLESLAYIPPPLVNEVRYLGQQTPTACWRTFAFDAGRYAFIAVDVSDYFDVNRVLVEEARSSNPARRTSIAYLFEGGGAKHSSAPDVSAWEDFIVKYTGREPQDDGTVRFSTLPFVSLADFNLALGKETTKVGPFQSPFVKYFSTDGSGGFYNASPGDTDWDSYSRMTFVTDSLDAPEEASAQGTTRFDLDAADTKSDTGQPFPKSFFNLDFKQRSASVILDNYAASGNKACQYLSGQNQNAKNCVSACGVLALADYLDKDDVPTSLALPTTERVPMVCAVRPMPEQLKVVIGREWSEVSANEVPQTSRDLEMTVTYRYKLEGGVNVDAWTAFPFRDRENFKDGYTADCRLAMFLSTDKMRLRTSDPRAAGDLLRDPTLSADGLNNGVVNLFLSGKGCSTKAISTPTDAVSQMDGFEFGDASTVFKGEDSAGIVLLKATFVCRQTWDSNNNVWTPTPTTANSMLKDTPTCDFSPLQTSGAAFGSFASTIKGNAVGTAYQDMNLPSAKLRFNLALWLAVRNSEKKVVDLVPACMSDDNAYNGMAYDDGFTDDPFQKVTGLSAPILKFDESDQNAEIDVFGSFQADFQKQSNSQDHDVTLVQKEGLVVRDPRYNYAPENWFAAASTINAQYWIDNTGCADAGCDGDIFMATSDQETLQSISELAFLPRFTPLNDRPDDQDCGGTIKNPERNWSDYPAKGSEAQANMMWRTYNPFDDGENGDGFEDLQEIFYHGGKGVCVNPYSDSTNVIMAAFANTPVSWRAASDNDDSSVNTLADKQTDVTTFNGKYTWNAYNANYTVAWEDLEDVAGQFMEEVRDAAKRGDPWQRALMDVFADNRGDGPEKLCGIELQKSGRFYSVDKKTVWGFSQDSFAARQQLFLVFFRAEPMMLGGGVAGVTPPQLGAKGVALVWRNPNNPSRNSTQWVKGYTGNQKSPFDVNTGYIPHQTRVLFYKQFD